MKECLPDIDARPWIEKKPPKKVLAIRLQAMGDTAITLPYLQYLHEILPSESQLDFLTRKECESIPKNIELFDNVFSIGGGRSSKRQMLCAVSMLPRLLFQHYDVVIDLQNNSLSKFVRKAIRPKAWSAFDRFSPLSAGERTRHTINAVGLGMVQLKQGFTLKKNLHSSIILQNNGWDGKSRLVILNPAAAFKTRNWPVDNYIDFTKLWLDTFPDTQFLVMGTSFIEEKAAYLQQHLGADLINLVNKTAPVEAFAILQLARLMVSEDSGLMHMAWVSGIPTLALFGATRSDWARPLGSRSTFLDSSDLLCGNCMLETCIYGDVHCLTRYSPQLVFERALLLVN